MIKTKNKMYTKRIICTMILLQVAFIFNKEGPSLNFTDFNWDEDMIHNQQSKVDKESPRRKYKGSFFGGDEVVIQDEVDPSAQINL